MSGTPVKGRRESGRAIQTSPLMSRASLRPKTVAKTWLQFFLPYTCGYFGNTLEKQLQAH
jgi:hypothetical protein